MGNGFEEAPHHFGHRQRLRDRMAEAGPNALSDYELLEMLLFFVNRRGDTKGQAKALLARFGTLEDVLAAPEARLREIRGIGPQAAQLFAVVRDINARTARAAIRSREVLSSWSAVIEYARRRMGSLAREELRILYLDQKNQLILDEVAGDGTVNHVPVYPREVIRRALELSASAIVLIHNHPSGDPTPSEADIAVTGQIASLAMQMGITLHDHLIIAGAAHCSLKAEGHF